MQICKYRAVVNVSVYLEKKLIRQSGGEMERWSPIVATASDDERSSSEGEYTVDTRAPADSEIEAGRQIDEDRGDGAAVRFGISGFGAQAMRLGRSGQPADQELRYLHLLWEPNRAAAGPDGTSKPGKVTPSRSRRRARCSVGPIGKDLHGTESFRCKLSIDL